MEKITLGSLASAYIDIIADRICIYVEDEKLDHFEGIFNFYADSLYDLVCNLCDEGYNYLNYYVTSMSCTVSECKSVLTIIINKPY